MVKDIIKKINETSTISEDKASFESVMHETRRFPPSKSFSKKSYINSYEQYKHMYDESINNPDVFWSKYAEEIHWFKKCKSVFKWDKKKHKVEWFKGGKTNVCYNCVDRHLQDKGDKIALISEADAHRATIRLTYKQLHEQVCKFANVLKKHGIKKGDMVCLYMPMIPELPVAMLACTRIGAIHNVVFGAFSSEALRHRIEDSQAKMLITADGNIRRGKIIALKDSADMAVAERKSIKKVIVVKYAGAQIKMKGGRDVWWHDEMQNASTECGCEEMDAEEPLFILYTSGTTGKPKGVLHTTGGYLVYVYLTFKYIFDCHDKDVHWCTADIGWITGHSYMIYGPLSNGATSVMFEGVPDYPQPNRFWEIIEKFKVSIFYTAPTVIRLLEKYGDGWTKKNDMSSLRLLGSVGEPINPEAWMWYYNNIGKKKCPIVDTWWQTETGGILISPLPGAHILKPGSASKPFFGVEPAVLRQDGSEAGINEGGYLVIKKPWPAMLRTIWGDHERFVSTYFSNFPGIYFTGDGARKDGDGDFWLMGRVDDVINVSGHRIGTAEVESALVANKNVAEAAVVPMPHEIKGQGIYAFVTLKVGVKKSDELKSELIQTVRKEIGPIATPDKIQFADALPKTRSGKIMRRILRKIAEGAGKSEIGDTTTLAEPNVVEVLLKERL